MTKELQKDKRSSSDPPRVPSEIPKNQVIDMEVDMIIHMAPKKEYPIKIKIEKIEKAKPTIDHSEFNLMVDLEEDNF